MKDLIEALTIFMKYSKEDAPTCCDAGVLHIMGVDIDGVSMEDRERLYELGFCVVSDSSGEWGWGSHRFGTNYRLCIGQGAVDGQCMTCDHPHHFGGCCNALRDKQKVCECKENPPYSLGAG